MQAPQHACCASWHPVRSLRPAQPTHLTEGLGSGHSQPTHHVLVPMQVPEAPEDLRSDLAQDVLWDAANLCVKWIVKCCWTDEEASRAGWQPAADSLQLPCTFASTSASEPPSMYSSTMDICPDSGLWYAPQKETRPGTACASHRALTSLSIWCRVSCEGGIEHRC